MQPVFSIVLPAYNEERFLPRSLGSVNRAIDVLGHPAEIIVSDNMSTDRTAVVAREFGARVVQTDIKSISAVRNCGANAATGKYIVFMDSDNMMAPNFLVDVKRVLDDGRYVGGGVGQIRVDRWSIGTVMTYAFPLWCAALFVRVSMGSFYTRLDTYHAIGGFNESHLIKEDMDFGKRLKTWGKKHGLRYKHLYRSYIRNSTRKCDEHGDYFVLTNPVKLVRGVVLHDKAVIDEFWYKPNR